MLVKVAMLFGLQWQVVVGVASIVSATTWSVHKQHRSVESSSKSSNKNHTMKDINADVFTNIKLIAYVVYLPYPS